MREKVCFHMPLKFFLKKHNFLPIRFEQKSRTLIPFLLTLNEKETMKYFIDAVENSKDQAQSFISKRGFNSINIDEISNLFKGKKYFKCLLDLNVDDNDNIKTVTLAVGDYINHADIIKVKMIKEPDLFGKWKIFHIEKE